jgi:diguanylate cyclase (GGDEF)-like protein
MSPLVRWSRVALSIRGSLYLGESVERKLVERLFARQNVTAMGCLGVLVEAATVYLRTGQWWIVAWGGISIALMANSIAAEAAFRRADPDRPFEPWLRWYLACLCINALLCGVGGAAASQADDALTKLLLFSTWTAFVIGASGRNAALPIAVLLYLAAAELPILVNAVLRPDFEHLFFLQLTFWFLIPALTVAREVYQQLVDNLCLDEERATLVARIERVNERLEASNERLAAMAALDGLTGIANRRFFDEAFAVVLLSAARDGLPVSVLMLDIDWFKPYNDRYGHQAGDECLRRVAHTMRASLVRPTDLIARYGGEEFIVLLPHTDAAGAAMVGERLRSAVCELAIEAQTSAAGVVTISIGGATWLPGISEPRGAELLGRADGALYEAKRQGRNRIKFASPAVATPFAAFPSIGARWEP